ncbi:hypothetical protein NW94_23540 [Burkholderia mallei]|nr:hypothetical protein BFR05_27685 [Burkholderia pseudomallei]ATD96500.1 hypothetical protein NW91_22835 [Burkholderia mallei]APG01599.1 hypothetical protein BFR06_27705 [Burkholderia pseudomallei]ATE01357.1 hypothetical protein NW92_23455 [Burkholderia mallei]ATE06278.1 hypothetical protein NW93_23750 [Burkholderia mallei]
MSRCAGNAAAGKASNRDRCARTRAAGCLRDAARRPPRANDPASQRRPAVRHEVATRRTVCAHRAARPGRERFAHTHSCGASSASASVSPSAGSGSAVR